jgi:hypothetical protein
MPAEHKFLKFILPAGAFAAVEAGTREWLIECRCGHRQDYWDAGGVRYKAVGDTEAVPYMRKMRKGSVA